MISLSLIITTYNRPDALDLVLKSVSLQNLMPREVIVADDGSTKKTRETLAKWSSKLPLIHSWQPDRGFRGARSRNLATIKTTSDYIVFVDGDCLLPKTFVESHSRLAEPRKLVAGGRKLLSRAQTEYLLANNKGTSFEQAFQGPKFLRIPLGELRNMRTNNIESVRSCNLGIFKDDFLSVSGFDEQFVGWGREDTDLVLRLINSGVNIKSARLAACVAHLWHPEESRESLNINDKRLQDTANLKKTQASNGVTKAL